MAKQNYPKFKPSADIEYPPELLEIFGAMGADITEDPKKKPALGKFKSKKAVMDFPEEEINADPYADIWPILDNHVSWYGGPGIPHLNPYSEDAGMYSTEAMIPAVNEHYQKAVDKMLSEDFAKNPKAAHGGRGSIVGWDLSKLTPENRAIVQRVFNQQYFNRLEQTRREVQEEMRTGGKIR